MSSLATDLWYAEVNDPGYDFEMPGFHQNPGTGHFTQIVWKDTKKVGCGVAGSFAVCRYQPAGNFLGLYE